LFVEKLRNPLCPALSSRRAKTIVDYAAFPAIEFLSGAAGAETRRRAANAAQAVSEYVPPARDH
jgi:hypothetical protein